MDPLALAGFVLSAAMPLLAAVWTVATIRAEVRALAERLAEHESEDRAALARIDTRLDAQRDLIHARHPRR